MDIGISAHMGRTDIYSVQEDVPVTWQSPLVSFELGYQYKATSIYLRHTSSMTDSRDIGLNEVGIKYRAFQW